MKALLNEYKREVRSRSRSRSEQPSVSPQQGDRDARRSSPRKSTVGTRGHLLTCEWKNERAPAMSDYAQKAADRLSSNFKATAIESKTRPELYSLYDRAANGEDEPDLDLNGLVPYTSPERRNDARVNDTKQVEKVSKGGQKTAQYRHGRAVSTVCGERSRIQPPQGQSQECQPQTSASFEAQLSDALRQIRRSEETLMAKEAEITAMEAQVLDSRAAVQEATAAFKASKQHVKSLEERLQIQIDRPEALEECRKAFSELQERHGCMESTVKDLQGSNALLSNQNSELILKVEGLEEDLREEKRQADARLTASEGRRKMEARLASVSPKHCQECRALEDVLSLKDKEMSELRAEVDHLQGKLRRDGDIEAEIKRRVASGLAEAKQQLEEGMSNEVMFLSEELVSSQKALVSATEYIQQLHDQVEQLQKQLQEAVEARSMQQAAVDSPADPETPQLRSPLGYVRSIHSDEDSTQEEETWVSAKAACHREAALPAAAPVVLKTAAQAELQPYADPPSQDATTHSRPKSDRGKSRYLQKSMSRLQAVAPLGVKPSPPPVFGKPLEGLNINSPTAFQV